MKPWQMERAFYHYHQWEDWKHGMYRMCESGPKMILASAALLGGAGFEAAATRVISEWPIATEVNFTNKTCNRRAWLGRASCCLAHGASESVTRPAWFLLTLEQQDAANATADRLIAKWEQDYAEIWFRSGRFNRRKRANRLVASAVPEGLRQLQWW